MCWLGGGSRPCRCINVLTECPYGGIWSYLLANNANINAYAGGLETGISDGDSANDL